MQWVVGVELDERQEGAAGNEHGDRKEREAWARLPVRQMRAKEKQDRGG